jgi:hypothetical protein
MAPVPALLQLESLKEIGDALASEIDLERVLESSAGEDTTLVAEVPVR